MSVFIREIKKEDEFAFIEAMKLSKDMHDPWVSAPITPAEFKEYYQRCCGVNFKGILVCNDDGDIAGVFNISEIVRGCFQSAYLGFYAVKGFDGKGFMGAGLRLVLEKVFIDMRLHRLEANIQPGNIKSIHLVNSNCFRNEGYSKRYLRINDIWCDHERWAITVEDWCDNLK